MSVTDLVKNRRLSFMKHWNFVVLASVVIVEADVNCTLYAKDRSVILFK